MEIEPNFTDINFPPSKSEKDEAPSIDFIDKDAKEKKHYRHQRFQEHLNSIVIYALWGIAIAIAICSMAYLVHMVTPTSCHFLNEQQLSEIRTFVVTAMLSSALTNYATRHINEE